MSMRAILDYKSSKKKLTTAESMKLVQYAAMMSEEIEKEGYPTIVEAILAALQNERYGAYALIKLWAESKDKKEKKELFMELKEIVSEEKKKSKKETVSIDFTDLEAIAENKRSFKDALIELVDKKGGVSKVALASGIPQSSLSIILNNDMMPRRLTLLRLSKTLGTDTIEVPANKYKKPKSLK